MSRVILAAVLSLFAVGCITPSVKSMNIQRSGIRCTGDTATTVSLDALANDAEVAAVKPKVKEVAMAMQLFLKDGKVADLTLPEFTEALRKLIPEEYRFLLDIALAQLQGLTVDTQKIGADNIERVNSLCVGVIRGCDLYDIKYRPVTDVEKAKVLIKEARTHGTITARFGVRMKKEMGVK
jgi:hypothetical protein